MVETQIASRGVRDERVLQAMRSVPREQFVPAALRAQAFDDHALPIDAGQTISQPFVVALMLEAAAISPGDAVLEVGTGSGYATALLSQLAARVVAIERHESLALAARERLERLGASNARVVHGDGTLGCPELAPFDAIIVSAGGPEIPGPLREQLAIGGRLVIPIGESRERQRLLLIRRVDERRWNTTDLGPVQFVPLLPGAAERPRGVDEFGRG